MSGRRILSLAAGGLATVVVLAAAAGAVIPDADGVLHLCSKGDPTKAGGAAVSIIDPDGEGCRAGEGTTSVYSRAGADAAFLGKTEQAADSNLLDGLDSTAFQKGGGVIVSDHVEMAVGSDKGVFPIPGMGLLQLSCENLGGSPSLQVGLDTLDTDATIAAGFIEKTDGTTLIFGGGFGFAANVGTSDGSWLLQAKVDGGPTITIVGSAFYSGANCGSIFTATSG